MEKKYKPLKKLSEYTNDELVAALSNCEFIESSRQGPICAEILKRMNTMNPLLPEKTIRHKGPIC